MPKTAGEALEKDCLAYFATADLLLARHEVAEEVPGKEELSTGSPSTRNPYLVIVAHLSIKSIKSIEIDDLFWINEQS